MAMHPPPTHQTYGNTPHMALCSVSDDFGIKSYNKDDVLHLITTLQQFYKVTIDWSGTHYYGLNIKWNYKK